VTAQQSSIDIETLARTWAHTASEAYRDQAEYLRALSGEEWRGPTACTEWTVYDLAAHVVGEAVWFPNLVRGVTKGEPPLPSELYREMKSWPLERIVDTLARAADELWTAVDEADIDHLQQVVDIGWTRLPMWKSTQVSAAEAVYHNWDLRAPRQPDATIPLPWARHVAVGMAELAPFFAHQQGIVEAPGCYLLQVGDGIGLVTIIAANGQFTVEEGTRGVPDVKLSLTADQYLRLLAGRFLLAPAIERGEVQVEGDPRRSSALNRIFQGV
jgi:uncharacterized protein (TIGR03083 family)